MIEQEQQTQKNNEKNIENTPNNDEIEYKHNRNESVSFKIFTDFTSQSGLCVQIIICWYLLQLQINGSFSLYNFGLDMLKDIQIEIHIFLWSLNVLGFLMVLVFVQNQAKKMFILHFFPFISPLFFIIISFYFHIIVLGKAKNILINPLSYVLLGGMTIAGLELFKMKIDLLFFLIGLISFSLSNIISWLSEYYLFSGRNQRKDISNSSLINCQSILLIVVFGVIQGFKLLEFDIELIPQIILVSSQQINYILFRYSYLKLRSALDGQEISPIQTNQKQVSHYVFIFYINLMLLISLLFAMSYYLPQILHYQNVPSHPQPPPHQPNKTDYPPKPPTNTSHPLPPKNDTLPLPDPRNKTENPFPKNNTIPIPIPIPKNETNPQPKNETLPLPKNNTEPLPKNGTNPTPEPKNETNPTPLPEPKNETNPIPLPEPKNQTEIKILTHKKNYFISNNNHLFTKKDDNIILKKKLKRVDNNINTVQLFSDQNINLDQIHYENNKQLLKRYEISKKSKTNKKTIENEQEIQSNHLSSYLKTNQNDKDDIIQHKHLFNNQQNIIQGNLNLSKNLSKKLYHKINDQKLSQDYSNEIEQRNNSDIQNEKKTNKSGQIL